MSMSARRPFAFVESWPCILLVVAAGITLAKCEHVDGPAAAPAMSVAACPPKGQQGYAPPVTTAATTITESAQ